MRKRKPNISQRFKTQMSGLFLVALYFLVLIVVLSTAVALVRLFWG